MQDNFKNVFVLVLPSPMIYSGRVVLLRIIMFRHTTHTSLHSL